MEVDMGSPVEDAKGRAKEAAGSVVGSESMKREGRAQQDKADKEERAARHEREAEDARLEAAEAEGREQSNQ
jgi:uncharacterized protein YjbJ (UPF0337 family)